MDHSQKAIVHGLFILMTFIFYKLSRG